MDQQKLTLFLDLTETLNYTETAERNFMTQGNVSKRSTHWKRNWESTFLIAAIARLS